MKVLGSRATEAIRPEPNRLLKTKQSARDKDKLDRLVLERALAELRRK